MDLLGVSVNFPVRYSILGRQRSYRMLFAPVLGDFSTKEFGTTRELVHSFDTIFNADPVVIESDRFQCGKDRVVVVQAFSDFSVSESLGVTLDTKLLLS